MCPQCNKDLSAARNKLGIHQEPPETDFDVFFSGTSGAYPRDPSTAPGPELDIDAMGEAELDLEDMGDEFEFTLDD
jgi:hypothetical protein